jgi:hypothetical protein
MNSFYFTHDYNAANDSKILFLRQQLGMEGYGIFWFIVEQLAQSGGFLPIKITPVLSMQMQVTEAKVRSVINDYELFDIVDENFYSQRLNKHLQIRKQLSESGKKGAKNRWQNGLPNGHPIDLPNGNKERKKEIKEIKKVNKESKQFAPPSIDEVVKFFEENGYTNGDKAWNYYNDGDWKDKNGDQVNNWKQKMRMVWFKDENKKQPTEHEKLAQANRERWQRERERFEQLNK